MKEWASIIIRAIHLVLSITCAVAGTVALFKGDPAHILVAYAAGAWVYSEIAQREPFK